MFQGSSAVFCDKADRLSGAKIQDGNRDAGTPKVGDDFEMSEQEVQDWIRNQIAANDVVVFMKGTKQFPQCGFSGQVAQILGFLGVDYKDVNVLDDIKAYTNWPTIPQLYVKGEFVGGCDIIREMFQEGELAQLLDEKGVAYDKSKMTA